MKIGTQVDTPYIYGLGERFSTNFRKTDGKSQGKTNIKHQKK